MNKPLAESIVPPASAPELSSILCRAAIALAPTITGEMMYMPGGVQTITPLAGGVGVPIEVLVNADGARELETQRAALAAKGKRPYFDFNHEDGAASFWPAEFFWKPDGIYCRGEWTASGKAKVEGKEWRQFSPVFHVDNKRAKPARIVCRVGAKPNMGGLVNDPAFHTILPLWAKDSHGNAAGENQNQNADMNEQELAALRAKNQELQTELDAKRAEETALKAKNENTALVAAEIRAKEAELKAGQTAEANAALVAKTAKLEADAKVRAEADADAAVNAAIARGAIAAKDEDSKKKWRALICADSSAAGLLAAIPGAQALAGRITPATPRVERGATSGRDAVEAYSALMAKQATAASMAEKAIIAREAAEIFRADIRSNEGVLDSPLVGANALGTVAGTLVTQRTLELLKFQFPLLARITTDFSDEQAQYSQQITTRIITPPTVGTYNTSTGYAQTDVTATDASVTINAHKHVQTSLNANNLASTARQLFSEFAEANAYAIAKELVDAVYGLILNANYANKATVTLANFARNDVVDLATEMTLLGVPEGSRNRSLLLTPTYFGKLRKDASATLNVVTALAAFNRPEIVTEGVLPELEGFQVINAGNLPGNAENLTGFAFSKSALVLATRLPQDYTQALPGASYGNVTVVTNPDSGFSVMQVEYVDHTLGSANQRMAWMYGKAVGQAAAGRRIVSA